MAGDICYQPFMCFSTFWMDSFIQCFHGSVLPCFDSFMFVSRDLQVISSESQVILALPRGQAGLYGCVWLGGGYLVERWCGWERLPFSLLRFNYWSLFSWKVVLLSGAFFILAFSLRIGDRKRSNLYGSLVIGGENGKFGLIMGCNLVRLWFSYRMVVKISSRTSVPPKILSTPPVWLIRLIK